MFNLRGFNILPLGHGTPRVAERKPGIQVSGESPGLIEKMKGNKTILTENSSPLEIWAKEALGLPEVQVQVNSQVERSWFQKKQRFIILLQKVKLGR